MAASADIGATLEVSVSATNGGGTTTATSAPTAAVQPASQGPQTFGTTTVGSGSDPMLADRKRVNRASLPVAGSVSKLSVYLQSTATSGSQTIRGVLYADSAGKPAGLLGVTNPLTFTSGQAAAWYDLSFPTPVALSAGTYWIGMISGSSSSVAAFRYTSVSASRAYNVNPYGSGPANPFGSVTVDSELMSVYATYTPS